MGLLGSIGRGVNGLLGGVGQVAGLLTSPLYRDITDPVARQQALLGLSAGLQSDAGIGAAGLMGRQAGQQYLAQQQAQQDEAMRRQFLEMQMGAFKDKQAQEQQDRSASATILGQITGRSPESFRATDPLMVSSQARRILPGELSPGSAGSPGVGQQAALATALANPGAVQGNPMLANLLMPKPKEAPKTRTINKGGTEIVQEWDGQQWRDVSTAPRWAPDKTDKPDNPMQLRKEFRNLQSVKEYETTLPQLVAARKSPDTGAGDLNLIYTVAKILDPGSVVREGELSLVIKSGSLMSQLFGEGRLQLGQGGRINQERRKQLLEMLNERVLTQRQAYDRDYYQYADYANRAGMNPGEVVGRHAANAFQATTQRAASRGGALNAIQGDMQKYGGP